MIGGTITGSFVLAASLIQGPALIPVLVVSAPAGFLVGYFVGAVTSPYVGPICHAFVGLPQIYLLRHGIASMDYFPNWKFVVHRPVVTAVGEETVWVVNTVEGRELR